MANTKVPVSQLKSGGTAGKGIVDDGANWVWTDYYDKPNLLVNPNWNIDQINEGTAYGIASSGVQTLDGWSASATPAAGVFSMQRVADPDNAAFSALKISCTTADASIAAGDVYTFLTAIEGYDAAALMVGTSSALPFTIQFKFKSNVAGVYGVKIGNSAATRSYISTITVPDAAEHEYSITVPGDTSGTWLYTNGVGMYLIISLAAGSTYQTTAGSWQAGNFLTTSAQCNFMSANTNVAYLKRVQLIPGSTVQAYRPADMQRELAKCQRYYEKSFDSGVAVAQNNGVYANTILATQVVGAAVAQTSPGPCYKISKRASPTITSYNPFATSGEMYNGSIGASCTGTTFGTNGTNGFSVTFTTAGGSGAGNYNFVNWSANARLS